MQSVNPEKYDVIPVYISIQGVWYTGEPLRSMNTYTPFKEDQKGIVRVSLDMTRRGHAVEEFAVVAGVAPLERATHLRLGRKRCRRIAGHRRISWLR
jgi:D-alanine-D-alanine ligase